MKTQEPKGNWHVERRDTDGIWRDYYPGKHLPLQRAMTLAKKLQEWSPRSVFRLRHRKSQILIMADIL